MKFDIAIDFGGSNISIFQKSLVLKEPCLIAVNTSKEEYRVVGVGNEAKALQGKTAENITIFSPLSEGVVRSEDYMALLLRSFLNKINKSALKKFNALISLPCGTPEEEKNVYRNVCYKAGIKDVVIVPQVICALLGAGERVHTSKVQLIASLGGSVCDVAVVNLNSIVKGASLGIGGRAMDVAIASQLADKKGVLVGVASAEKLKIEIGSLFENDTLSTEVVGVNTTTKMPESIVVSSRDIRESLVPYFEEIFLVLQTTINLCPPEMSGDLSRNGLLLTGGLSRLSGVAEFFSKALKIPVKVADNAETATILGAGKLLSDTDTLNEILENL